MWNSLQDQINFVLPGIIWVAFFMYTCILPIQMHTTKLVVSPTVHSISDSRIESGH
jgi:hypothetical protein